MVSRSIKSGAWSIFLDPAITWGGDELQGIKKGILELADAILINKADGESENLANKTRLHYQSALSLLTQKRVLVAGSANVFGFGAFGHC